MIILINRQATEVSRNPSKQCRGFCEHKTNRGMTIHLDEHGEPIEYTSYKGEKFVEMNFQNFCVKDLGDRIEMQEYVGGIHGYYRYHISKDTREPIAYFESLYTNLEDGQVDVSQYRVSYSIDLGDHIIIRGLYGWRTRIFRKSDNSLVEFTTPDGKVISRFISTKGESEDWISVEVDWQSRYIAEVRKRSLSPIS